MSDREIVEYYYKHIEPNQDWLESDGRFFYATPDCDAFDYAEHSGSDIHWGMKPDVLKHIKEKPIREILKKIIENE